MSLKIYEVSGKFVLPGTRKHETFSARVVAENPIVGARELAPLLQERFGRHLPEGYSFSPLFALHALRWVAWHPAKEVTAA